MCTQELLYKPNAPLLQSNHVSWFHRRGHIYAYHDLFGFLLEMSPDIHRFWSAFDPNTARSLKDVSESTPDLDPAEVARTLVEHACLIYADTDERAVLAERFPVKARWLCAEDLGAKGIRVVVARNTQTPAKIHTLTGQHATLWRLIDGKHTVSELAKHLDDSPTSLNTVLDAIISWTHSDLQLLRISPVSTAFFARRSPPPYLASAMPFPRLSEGHFGSSANTLQASTTDLSSYHNDTITDAHAQFEDVETTLAHLFREPHPALQHRTYGGAFLHALLDEGLFTTSTQTIVEVGGGVGFFARGLLDELRQVRPTYYTQSAYTIADISPELSRSQRTLLHEHQDHTSCLLMDGERLEGFDDASVDLVISNEVIADMRCGRIRRLTDPATQQGWDDPDAWLEALEDEDDTPEELEGDPETIELLRTYSIDTTSAPLGEVWVNTGSMRFVETIARVLKPGGGAVVTEFGGPWSWPVESIHLDHAEISIHFGHLIQVARANGLEARWVHVPDLLQMDESAEMLTSTRTWFRNFGALLQPYTKEPLRKIAWTKPMLEDLLGSDILERLEGLRWAPLSERTQGLKPREFCALILRKPLCIA